MPCHQPAPEFYSFIMHNLHFLSTPTYILTLVALFKETSLVFQRYKYFLIAHIFVNFLSEAYVTFGWLPLTHLPYDVYKTTGWLADWDVSGAVQFMVLAQFIITIGVSILEMFYHRYQAVVLHQSGSFSMKLPRYCMIIYRILSVVHILSITWIIIDDQTLVYQKNKKEELFRKYPDLPEELRCHTVFILAPEDPILIFNVALWAVFITLGTIVIISTVVFINKFLNAARNLSKETKKLQRMLVVSLLAQAAIHGGMIIFPVAVQIWQIVVGLYNNTFATILLFFVAYHGFFSTCAMIFFTKQIRQKVIHFSRRCIKPKAVLIEPQRARANSTYIDSIHN